MGVGVGVGLAVGEDRRFIISCSRDPQQVLPLSCTLGASSSWSSSSYCYCHQLLLLLLLLLFYYYHNCFYGCFYYYQSTASTSLSTCARVSTFHSQYCSYTCSVAGTTAQFRPVYPRCHYPVVSLRYCPHCHHHQRQRQQQLH